MWSSRYVDVCRYLTWDSKTTTWTLRKQGPKGGDVLGRLRHIKSTAGELYYLRLLLLHAKGKDASSWSAMKASGHPGETPSFEGKARELGLLQDDTETRAMLEEASCTITSSSKLIELFAETLIWLEVHDPVGLWQHFLSLLEANHKDTSPIDVYLAVDEVLIQYSKSMMNFHIHPPQPEICKVQGNRAQREYTAELRTETQQQQERHDFEQIILNEKQREAFKVVVQSIEDPHNETIPNVVYVNGPGGTGKTHLYKKVLHYVRMQGKIAIAVSMYGISALLLPGGRTAHSTFRLPIPVPLDRCTCNIKMQSITAELLRDASVIVWDEAPTASKVILQAVDEFLQELLECTRPFGGKTVLLGGDFRQIPPVLRHVDRNDEAAHTLLALPWWRDKQRVFKHSLTKNMRATDEAYAAFCLSVGDGTAETVAMSDDGHELDTGVIQLPTQLNTSADFSATDLLRWVYEGHERVEPAAWHTFYHDRACVAPTNEACDELNDSMNSLLDTSTDSVLYSRDSAIAEVDTSVEYSVEFLNSLTTGGLPPHALRLRRGSLVILLRNYAPRKGLCNGTRLVVDRVCKRLLIVRVVSGPAKGNIEAIPRICCDSSGDLELPFVLRRFQFPVKLAWCITINKAQGQTVGGRLGIFCPFNFFATASCT